MEDPVSDMVQQHGGLEDGNVGASAPLSSRRSAISLENFKTVVVRLSCVAWQPHGGRMAITGGCIWETMETSLVFVEDRNLLRHHEKHTKHLVLQSPDSTKKG